MSTDTRPALKFQCKCGKKLTAPGGSTGKSFRCPRCGKRLRVPGESSIFARTRSILRAYELGTTSMALEIAYIAVFAAFCAFWNGYGRGALGGMLSSAGTTSPFVHLLAGCAGPLVLTAAVLFTYKHRYLGVLEPGRLAPPLLGLAGAHLAWAMLAGLAVLGQCARPAPLDEQLGASIVFDSLGMAEIALVALASAVLDEILFRGFLLGKVSDFAGPFQGVLWSASFYALTRVDASMFAYWFALGVVLGAVRVATGGLLVPVILGTLMGVYVHHPGFSLAADPAGAQPLAPILGGSALLAIACLSAAVVASGAHARRLEAGAQGITILMPAGLMVLCFPLLFLSHAADHWVYLLCLLCLADALYLDFSIGPAPRKKKDPRHFPVFDPRRVALCAVVGAAAVVMLGLAAQDGYGLRGNLDAVYRDLARGDRDAARRRIASGDDVSPLAISKHLMYRRERVEVVNRFGAHAVEEEKAVVDVLQQVGTGRASTLYLRRFHFARGTDGWQLLLADRPASEATLDRRARTAQLAQLREAGSRLERAFGTRVVVEDFAGGVANAGRDPGYLERELAGARRGDRVLLREIVDRLRRGGDLAPEALARYLGAIERISPGPTQFADLEALALRGRSSLPVRLAVLAFVLRRSPASHLLARDLYYGPLDRFVVAAGSGAMEEAASRVEDLALERLAAAAAWVAAWLPERLVIFESKDAAALRKTLRLAGRLSGKIPRLPGPRLTPHDTPQDLMREGVKVLRRWKGKEMIGRLKRCNQIFSMEVHEDILEAMTEMAEDPHAAMPVVYLLSSPFPKIAARARRIFAEEFGKKGLPALREVVADRQAGVTVRTAALDLLSQLGGKEDSRFLLKVWADEREGSVAFKRLLWGVGMKLRG